MWKCSLWFGTSLESSTCLIYARSLSVNKDMDTGLVRVISVTCCIFKSCNTDDKNIVSFPVSVRIILLQVRVNSLLCLGKLLEFMDKWYVLDEILPILQNVKSREPAVLMSILGMTLCLFYVLFHHLCCHGKTESCQAVSLPWFCDQLT